jgi:ribonuclease HI
LEKEKSWQRMRFKGNKVWVSTHPDGKPAVKEGKVLIKYRLDQDYEYRVHPHSLKPLDTSPPTDGLPSPVPEEGESKVKKRQPKSKRDRTERGVGTSANAICIYTDGASSGNPGPAGIGILLRHGKHEKEISKYIGIATNNIAELEAVRVALQELKKTAIPVRIFTDSSYVHGLLALGWKPKKNQELVDTIKEIMKRFEDIKFVKVRGHAGNEGNERADLLATTAIKSEAD